MWVLCPVVIICGGKEWLKNCPVAYPIEHRAITHRRITAFQPSNSPMDRIWIGLASMGLDGVSLSFQWHRHFRQQNDRHWRRPLHLQFYASSCVVFRPALTVLRFPAAFPMDIICWRIPLRFAAKVLGYSMSVRMWCEWGVGRRNGNRRRKYIIIQFLSLNLFWVFVFSDNCFTHIGGSNGFVSGTHSCVLVTKILVSGRTVTYTIAN